MKRAYLFLIILVPSMTLAKLSPEAQNYLNKIPEKKLTLDFVIGTALRNAEAFRIAGYDYATAGLEELGQLDPATDTFFQGGASYGDDNSEKTSPFQALRAKKWDWSLGFTKGWSTGTQTSVDWIYDTNNLEFPAGLGSFGNSFVTNYKQSAAQVSLSQSLLKDSFGYSFRKKRLGARSRAKAIQWKTRNDIEALTLNFILQYYQSWFMQEQVRSLQAQAKRQARLVRILKKRSLKGAVEKPDLIQIEALLAATRVRLKDAVAQLASQWEQLVFSLKLPMSFLSVDPIEIPIVIDNPLPLSLRVCGQKEPIKTANIYSLEKSLEAVSADFKAAKNDSLPDLKLTAAYRGNSIDDKASETLQNVLKGSDDNGFGRGPSWNVGLKLKWSLDNSSARAMRTQKYIEKERITSRLSLAIDDLKSQWRDSCRRLNVQWANEKVYDNVVQEQKKRVKAEERRFRLGRIRVNQLVTAEDDLGQWELQSQQKKIESRQLAWQVQQLSGELYRKISPGVESLLKENNL